MRGGALSIKSTVKHAIAWRAMHGHQELGRENVVVVERAATA